MRQRMRGGFSSSIPCSHIVTRVMLWLRGDRKARMARYMLE